MAPAAAHLFVSRVKVRGFKCVRDEWLEVRLQPGINVIVGQNGCGKSTLLQAICFALAAPAALLGVRHLGEVRNRECTEVTTVEVDLSSVSSRPEGPPAVHVVTSLAPDGTRSHRMDGRVATGKQIKQRLRSGGVCLWSQATVVGQAAVTRLADSNDPAALAAVVGEVSGADDWKQRSCEAEAEAKRAAADKAGVDKLMGMLEGKKLALLKEEQARQACGQLGQRIAQHDQRTAAALQEAVQLGEREQAHIEQHRAGIAAEVERLQAQEARCTADMHGLQPAPPSSTSPLPLQDKEAAAAEEVDLLQSRLSAHAELEERCTQAQAALKRAAAAHALGVTSLHAARQAWRQAVADSQAAGTPSLLADSRGALEQEVAALAQAIAQAQETCEQAEAEAGEARQSVRGAQQECAAAKAMAQKAADAARGHPTAADCRSELSRQQFALQCAQRQGEAVESEVHGQRATLPQPAAPGLVPLHSCFSFRAGTDCSTIHLALSIMAGRHLGTMVAPTAREAAEVLDAKVSAHSGVRIWPRDTLQVSARVAEHRRAAATFEEGQVVIPMDLLDVEDPLDLPAVTRAFGTHAIAVTDAVAATLLQRFGVPSITPEGRVTSRGQLTGGWRGQGGSAHAGLMRAKMRSDAACARARSAREQVALLQRQLAEGKVAVEEAEAGQGRMERCAERAAACAAKLELAQTRLEAAENVAARIRADLAPQQDARAAKERVLASLAGDKSGAAAAQALLQEAARLEEAVVACEARLGALKQEWDAAAAEVVVAQQQLGAATAEAAHLQEALKKAEHRLGEVRVHQRQLRTNALALQEEQHHQAAEYRRLEQRRGLVRAALEEAQEDQAATAAELQAIQEGLVAATDLLADHAPAASAPPCTAPFPGSLAEALAAVPALAAERKRLQAELRRLRQQCGAGGHPPGHSVESVDAAIHTLRTQQEVIALGNLKVREGAACVEARVESYNEELFDKVAAVFGSLTGRALRGMEAQVVRVGRPVREHGARFRYRQVGGTGADPQWREGMETLSGGQRSAVSLAFLGAAAAAADSQGGVLVMDEVDAALDTANQSVLGEMLGMLCNRDSGGGVTQVLLVSHSPTLHAYADRLVKLSCASGQVQAEALGGGDPRTGKHKGQRGAGRKQKRAR